MTLHASRQWLSQSINHSLNPQKYIPYLSLTSELWHVFCEDLGEIWPRYNGSALYIHLYCSRTCSCIRGHNRDALVQSTYVPGSWQEWARYHCMFLKTLISSHGCVRSMSNQVRPEGLCYLIHSVWIFCDGIRLIWTSLSDSSVIRLQWSNDPDWTMTFF